MVDNADDTEQEKYKVNTRWVIPHRLNVITFIGKDVLAIAHDIYIVFFNFKNNTELVYAAHCDKTGDGVDVVSGYKTTIFAFAEKRKDPRIFIVRYPKFEILVALRDKNVIRYKGLCLMENDWIAGFSGFPNYVVSVWCWRTQHILVTVQTDVVRRNQIFMASRSQALICQCWDGGLNVWEVAACYKQSLMMKRTKEEGTGWEIAEPTLVDVCWGNDGQLYAIDEKANLYGILSDGIGMVGNLEWSESLQGSHKPCMCSYFNGILIYGPDQRIRALKKAGDQWKVAWNYIPDDEVVRLVSNTASDEAAMWTEKGFVYRIKGESEDKIDVMLFTFKQRYIKDFRLIAPKYTHVATINSTGMLCLYDVAVGNLVLVKYISGGDVSLSASPVDPLLVIFGEIGKNYGMALFNYDGGSELEKVGSVCLTHQIISRVLFSPGGRELVAAAMSAGHIFIYNISEDYKLTLVRYTEIGRGLADCFLMRVGMAVRVFCLVLFSDRYAIGMMFYIICNAHGSYLD